MRPFKIRHTEGLAEALALSNVPNWFNDRDVPAGLTVNLYGKLWRSRQVVPAGTNPPPDFADWPAYWELHRAAPDEETAQRLDDFDTALAGKAPLVHHHDDRYYTEQEVDAKLTGKADTNHQHTASQVVDFSEAVQDAVAAFMRAGGGVTLTYDDASNTYTISSSPGETFDPEKTRDAIGAALVPLGLIDIAINDAGDTISISTRATQNQSDAYLLSRYNHTGTQDIDTVDGLSTTLANKTNNATTAALGARVTVLERPLQADELVAGKEAFLGLTPRQALLKLINGGTTVTPTDPTGPTTGNSYVEDAYVEDGYVE
ncbi:hypothetical protein [Hymenobacter glacieicola]|uniref:Uncharacterized protein n=1 Tax=Hymenobacter glacieicola TaxID=1562124 RepID=A0ABQ1WK16_9BACT|nr:hypothetical protein [Hymenobacter glacieicola]GGG34273.1 hypothetical protein GCM10011378_08360 [Hymenobacter glacieicola]